MNIRFGFSVDDVDGVLERLKELSATIVSSPAESDWGRRAVVKDFDGQTIEMFGRQRVSLRGVWHAHRRPSRMGVGQSVGIDTEKQQLWLDPCTTPTAGRL